MSNQWWEIKIRCSLDQEESIFYQLEQLGCRGMATEVKDQSCLIKAYLPQGEAEGTNMETFALRLHQDALRMGLPLPVARWSLLDEEDWASSWKQYWEPTPVGDRFLVCPAWLSPPDENRTVIRLDPGAAFGTGTHPTTQLCLEALERINVEGTTMADIGCGSGILSIGALLLGAGQIYGVDLDPLAVSATESNRQLNAIEASKLVATQGSVEQIGARVDGILCNILASVIIGLVPQMHRIANPNTWGLLSGILSEQAAQVTDILQQNGWQVINFWEQQPWCCLHIQRTAQEEMEFEKRE